MMVRANVREVMTACCRRRRGEELVLGMRFGSAMNAGQTVGGRPAVR